jgi:hypothetical protein
VAVGIDHTPKYEQISRRVAELAAKGASVNTIAAALGQTWETVDQALRFTTTGQRPVTKPPGKRTGTRTGLPKYVSLSPEVVRLRDEKQMAFKKIADLNGISESTATRAYDHGHPEAVRDAAEQGNRPRRGLYSHLGTNTLGRIRAALEAGDRSRVVAATVGCGTSTVYRIRRSLHMANNTSASDCD